MHTCNLFSFYVRAAFHILIVSQKKQKLIQDYKHLSDSLNVAKLTWYKTNVKVMQLEDELIGEVAKLHATKE